MKTKTKTKFNYDFKRQKMKKLSAYTIAKNCSDITDVMEGQKELMAFINKFDISKKPALASAYIRFFKLGELKRKLENNTKN